MLSWAACRVGLPVEWGCFVEWSSVLNYAFHAKIKQNLVLKC